MTKAESILLQIKKALDAEDTDDESGSELDIQELSQEFYSQIPHKIHHKEDFKTKSVIAKKQDLCQVIQITINCYSPPDNTSEDICGYYVIMRSIKPSCKLWALKVYLLARQF